jgi:hypothetical protein
MRRSSRGLSYTKQSYREDHALPYDTFVTTYRDGLFAAGWKLIESPKIDPKLRRPKATRHRAHYMTTAATSTSRSRGPEGAYEINVADVGEEDWSAMLAQECKLRVPSIHFDLDRRRCASSNRSRR